MDVGLQMVFASYGWTDVSDEQVWDEEIALARLAADSGFDALWSVEHHFNDYSFCPDNLQLMAYLAAVCPNVDLGTAAVILPWNDPLRVAERAHLWCPNSLHMPWPGDCQAVSTASISGGNKCPMWSKVARSKSTLQH